MKVAVLPFGYRFAKIGVLIGFSILFFLGCVSASEITEVPDGALVVDVRTPSEYADWHYPDARNIPVEVLSEKHSLLGDKNQSIIVYCRSGNRSTTAKKILIENGFTNVKNGGGLKDMKRFVKAL
jgi:phage shock protein E